MHFKNIFNLIVSQKEKIFWMLLGLTSVKAATSTIPVLVGSGVDSISAQLAPPRGATSYDSLQIFISEYSHKLHIHEIYLVVALISILSVFLMITAPLQQRLQTKVIQNVVLDVTIDWLKVIFKKDLTFFKEKNAARTANILNRGIHGHEKLMNQVINVILPVVFEFAFASFILIHIGGFISLAFIFCAVIIQTLITLAIIHKRRSMISILNEIEDDSAEQTQEILSKGLIFQFYKGTEIAIAKLKAVYSDYAKQCVKISFSGAHLSWLPFQFQTIGYIAALILGLHLVQTQGQSMGQILILISFFSRFSSAASESIGSFRILDQFKLDVQEAERILNYQDYFRDGKHIHSITSVSLEAGQIHRNGVQLQNPRLLEFNCGDQIALIGASGSGKSTLLELFAGLDEYSRRIIKWNGSCLEHWGSRDQLRLVRYSPQDPMIFKGLFSENIFQQCSGPAQLLNALNIEHLQDHRRGEISIKSISGGEAKRVALARVLHSNTDVYLLDEPTAGLHDIQRERTWDIIQEQTKNGILITVTHDEDQLGRFNKVIKVENGFVRVVKWENSQILQASV